MIEDGDEYASLMLFAVGLIAITLYLTIRYLIEIDRQIEALRLEFYRPPRVVDANDA